MLLEGLKDEIKKYLNDVSLSDEQVSEIADRIITDDEFKQVLYLCIKYYRGKQTRGELENDRMGNLKRK